jgi:hypothetical protein
MGFLGLCLFFAGIALILDGVAVISNRGATTTAFINLLAGSIFVIGNFIQNFPVMRCSLFRCEEAFNG